MQWNVFLLILMGQCSVFTCSMLYEYHFNDETKTWAEAQSYCKEKYTDLATVYDMADMKKLIMANNGKEAWIGLYNENDSKRTWQWSLPGVEYKETEENWATGEPNNKDAPENCVRMDIKEDKAQKWVDVPCSANNTFICYNATNELGIKFHFINMTLSWQKAQNYCRENYTDLVSGLHQLNDSKFKNLTQPKAQLWIGLFRNNWMWSDGSNFSFRDWDQELLNAGKHERWAVLRGTGKWGAAKCDEKKPFFCYKDKRILINESKTWVEALYYCREKYNDLVSITDAGQQKWVQEKAKKASSTHVWLGLRYTCTLDFWFWVTDEAVKYKNWDSDKQTDDCNMSGAMDRGGHHKWFKKPDNQRFNFICTV
ncbi:macrophage mannose receptor 1-like [Toxotes jaculatrix]|uniref:macrophage mannose receptor 1-like n=1 Tax=Toxotes jaculatrix TaxID=941984 RepID=UPI001B3ABB7B|nr:macrophage mannose receptor 1-like [Toxotes jaculatrix]